MRTFAPGLTADAKSSHFLPFEVHSKSDSEVNLSYSVQSSTSYESTAPTLKALAFKLTSEQQSKSTSTDILYSSTDPRPNS